MKKPSTKPKQVILACFDSLHAAWVRKLVRQGYLPTFRYLMDHGFVSDVIPTVPAQTASGWVSVATGATPSTHGITGFSVRLRKDPLYMRRDGFDSRYCRAETLWEVAEKAGKKVILLKYPGSWPPKIKEGIQVDGQAGYAGRVCQFAIAPPHCFSTENFKKHLEAPGDAKNLTVVKLEEASGWRSLPTCSKKPLETVLSIRNLKGEKVKDYYLLVYGDDRYDTVAVCKERTFSSRLTELKVGEWSDWMIDEFSAEGKSVEGATKFKLLHLSPDAVELRLYMHQIHRTDGFTVPERMARELLENVGPYFEYTGPRELWYGWFDLETQLEIYQQHTEWILRAIEYLSAKYPWDVFVFQWHPIDYMLHIVWSSIDESHPLHNPKKKERSWRLFVETFRLADRILSRVLELMGKDTLLVVIGDHGHVQYHSRFLIGNLLLREGLLAVKRNEKTGKLEIDWSKSKAVPVESNYIYINLKDREPTGIVDPSEYEALRNRIIDLLYSIRDPRTGEHPVLFAVKREDASALGLYGDYVGDVVYCLRMGYETMVTPILEEGETGSEHMQLFRYVEPFREHTSEHSGYALNEDINTLLILYGPGIRQGYYRKVPVRLIDIAPTVAYLLDLPFPKQCEGSVIFDSLEE
ncbi:MAG: hypothetical protein DRJ51_02690 [Thermoprotei archaeon]|nr:MAG: hypothetical protein DRJ36_02295 [Thermoprotei archaeon]RLE81945.1 MAG: hypothetical protein DRJ51_02690 [Thermoprotei archaeon]RLF02831.1 MAG: hypothetical protein DRJ59_02470 [Thermoprotei archaeon]